MISKARVRFCLIFMLLAVTLVVFSGVSSASSKTPRGTVEDANPGVYASRGGKWVPIMLGSDLYEFETIATNANGYAALRFDDDTLVELGANTVAHTMLSLFEPERAMFQVHVDKGEVRLGTGSIGLKNPKGIKLVTPKNIFITRNCIANFLITPEREIVDVEWMPDGVDVVVINAESKNEYRMTAEGSAMVTDAQNNVSIETP
ncbi:FecR family protein [Synergistaceae bacterium OttesenSCG-928-I11]|nr:FecR family protein [Synergistaceae bacterium OttesenSCG-928-I11]